MRVVSIPLEEEEKEEGWRRAREERQVKRGLMVVRGTSHAELRI